VPRAYVALGSNLGDRRATLLAAVAALAEHPDVDVVAVSSLIETDPVGVVDQPRFLNGAAALDTRLGAHDLLALLLEVERRFGREREGVPAHGPRTLDLDLLLYGDEEIDEPGLRVPHPRLAERAFVLEPLAELAPALEVPGKGTIQALLARLHSP
jgi:2-amino-4-hydroxy-6-hydroxymethyldihydropteridine diphosphokinase